MSQKTFTSPETEFSVTQKSSPNAYDEKFQKWLLDKGILSSLDSWSSLSQVNCGEPTGTSGYNGSDQQTDNAVDERGDD